MGRRIFDNIRKAMSYVFAMHIPIIGITLFALLLKWPLILFPIHILFLELIIDPTCSIVFEAERAEKNIMLKKPRNPNEKIFNKNTLIYSIIQGSIILIIVLLIFYLTLRITGNEYDARTLSFCTLIFSNLLLIASNRSLSEPIFKTIFERNRAFWFVVGGAITFLALGLYVPFLREIFKFSEVKIIYVLIGFGAAVLSIFSFEIVKYIRYVKDKYKKA
jgi:Ca2+-transporting ATPase